MKVLLWATDAKTIPGGHMVQFQQTAKFLAKLGIAIDIADTDDV